MFNDKKIFKFGQSNYKMARVAAEDCSLFLADDEDEQVDSVLESCYNCKYRRWTADSFQCLR